MSSLSSIITDLIASLPSNREFAAAVIIPLCSDEIWEVGNELWEVGDEL